MEKVLDSIKDDAVIVSFLSKNYFQIFKLFYEYISRFNLSNLVIVCLDKVVFDKLESFNVKRIYIEYEIKAKVNFWKFRLEKLIELFEKSKKNIIHTDLDCFWFKDIYSLLLKRTKEEYDFIGHMAKRMPEYVSKELGFVLCCGLFMIRYSPENVDWIKAIVNMYPEIEDDQILINHYILHHRLYIETFPNSYSITKVIQMDNKKKIGIINPYLISRNFYGIQNMYGFHPFLRSNNVRGKVREFYNYFR